MPVSLFFAWSAFAALPNQPDHTLKTMAMSPWNIRLRHRFPKYGGPTKRCSTWPDKSAHVIRRF